MAFPAPFRWSAVITLAELEFGVSKSRDARRNRDALTQFLLPLEVANFERQATVLSGQIRAALETQGSPIGGMDFLIAGPALSLDVRLATSNERELRRVAGLRVENWLEP